MLRVCGAVALLLACGEATTTCAGLAGKWYDEGSDDWMLVTESGCELTTKYGRARVSGVTVAPTAGILSTLGLGGQYHEGTRSIRWSNGVRWTMVGQEAGGGGSGSGSGGSGVSESRFAALEQMAAGLQQSVTLLQEENRQLKVETGLLREQVTALSACVNCGGVPPPPPSTAPPSGPATPQPAQDADIVELRAMVEKLNASMSSGTGSGKPGRDGYCAVQPNITSVYIPVTRYPRRRWMAEDVCVAGAAAARGPPGSAGVPSMVTKPTITDSNCAWGDDLLHTPVYAYKGDTMMFFRRSKSYNVYRMADEKAYDECDFSKAKLVAGLLDLEAVEANGGNYSYTFEAAGEYYFASDKTGKSGEERREYCWSWRKDGTYKKQKSNWGRGAKMTVIVLDPTSEVLAQCPLYDPTKFGVSTGGQADSESVERLKGAVGAISRQLIQYEVRIQERVRAEGNSGLTLTRSSGQGTDPFYQESFVGSGPANAHNHADFKYTIGLGEFGAVLNGVQFTTRHNDYSMLQPDDTLTVEEYISSWPPKSRELEFPPVPPSVTGSVDAQVKEMREYFRAFHMQDTSIRADYDKYFWPNLCYLEGTWLEAQESVAEPFASDRHHIDADTWEDLNDKVNFLFNNGQKSSAENLPFLPSSFRGMRGSKAGDVFEPRIGQWFYRINCVPIKEKVSTKRFRVANDLHLQFARSRPATRAQLADTTKAIFEMNPTVRKTYADKNAWPHSRTTLEFLDELMEQVPGFDGPNAFTEDQSMGPMCGLYNGSGPLNSARYSRYYSMLEKDAMGQTKKKRAYNDLMFAAQTKHPKVSPQEACVDFTDHDFASAVDKKRVTECADVKDKFKCFEYAPWDKDAMDGGASGAKCVWSNGRCKYKKCWVQRWSYALPLEFVFSTPLTNWNPYDIDYSERNTDGYKKVVANGANGATAAKAYDGSRRDKFFRTPSSFFKDPKNVDPADTSGGVTYVKNKKGQVKEVRASGHWLLFPEIEGVGHVRQRYPIMPLHEAGSTTWKEAKAIQELLMGKETSQEVRDIIAETRASAYGAELRLLSGQGHEHRVSVSPYELQKLKSGQWSSLKKHSTTDSAHSHYVELDYDASRGIGKEFSMKWCTTVGSDEKETCPSNVLSQPGACGSTRGGQDCCYAKCPDNHPGVEVVI